MFRLASLRASLLALITIPVLARADAFQEFRIPDNRTLQWTGSGSTGGSWFGDRTYAAHDASDRVSASLGSAFSMLLDSDARRTTVSANVSFQGNRSRRSSEVRAPGNPPTGSAQVERESATSMFVSIEHRRYANDATWFVGGSASLSAALRRDRESDFTHLGDAALGTEESDYLYRSDRSGYRAASLSVSIGTGRVRNATGVYEARMLESRLLARGELTRSLGVDARCALASLFYARDDFHVVDHPEIPVWDRIEAILRADGALRDSTLTAADMARLTVPYHGSSARFTEADLLPRAPIQRQMGWTIGVQVQGLTSHDWQDISQHTWFMVPPTPMVFDGESHASSHGDLLRAGFAAEYHRPLSLALQLDASGYVLATVVEHRDGFIEAARVNLSWVISDRWLVGAGFRQDRTLDERSDGWTIADLWSASAFASVDYYLRDHLTVTAAIDQQYRKRRNNAMSIVSGVFNPWSFSQGGDISVGLTYRFAGWASLPWVDPRLPR
jgi:hypothetical protein